MHLYTLIFVQFGVLSVSYFALYLFYKLNKDKGVKYWRDGALMASIGSLCLTLFEYLPLAMSVIPGVLGIMFGYIYFWHGTKYLIYEKHHGSELLSVFMLLIILLVIPTVYLDDYGIGYGLRVVLMSFVLTLFPFLSAKNLLSEKKITIGSIFLVIAFTSTAAVSFARLLLTILDLQAKPKAIDLISFYLYPLLYVVLVLGVIMFVYEKLHNVLNEQATTDPLTKLRNRRYFYDIAEKVLSAAIRRKTATTLALLDLDFFKKINDEYGHNVGDLALLHFSEIAASEIRTEDTLARLGGEEFIILFPDTDKHEAKMIVERIRLKLEGSLLQVVDEVTIPMTVSAGLASKKDDESIHCLLKRADQSLYQAKENGRNCCVSSELDG